MQTITTLTHRNLELLHWSAKNIKILDLVELVNDTIQRGPSPNVKNSLYQLSCSNMPDAAWSVLEAFVDWGAGVYVDKDSKNIDRFLIDAVLLDMILVKLKKIKDSVQGDSSCASEIKKTGPKILPPNAKKKRDDNESEFEIR